MEKTNFGDVLDVRQVQPLNRDSPILAKKGYTKKFTSKKSSAGNPLEFETQPSLEAQDYV